MIKKFVKWIIILIVVFVVVTPLTYLKFMDGATPLQQTIGFIAGTISAGIIFAVLTALVIKKALKSLK